MGVKGSWHPKRTGDLGGPCPPLSPSLRSTQLPYQHLLHSASWMSPMGSVRAVCPQVVPTAVTSAGQCQPWSLRAVPGCEYKPLPELRWDGHGCQGQLHLCGGTELQHSQSPPYLQGDSLTRRAGSAIAVLLSLCTGIALCCTLGNTWW